VNLSSLFFQLGLTVVFVGLAAAGIFWAIKSGQYDDFDGPAQRILMDDDDPMIPFNEKTKLDKETEPSQKAWAKSKKIKIAMIWSWSFCWILINCDLKLGQPKN